MSVSDEALRMEALAAALANVAVDGWSPALMRRIGVEAGLDAPTLARLYPGGVGDLMLQFSREADAAAVAAVGAEALAAMKVRERIRALVLARLHYLAPHKEAARAAAEAFATPPLAAAGLKAVASAADTFWRAAGDTSVDFNWYTKRTLLGGVLTATMLRWFADEDPDMAATTEFLDARIEDVMQIEKAKAAAGRLTAGLPSPAALLGALRYGRKN